MKSLRASSILIPNIDVSLEYLAECSIAQAAASEFLNVIQEEERQRWIAAVRAELPLRTPAIDVIVNAAVSQFKSPHHAELEGLVEAVFRLRLNQSLNRPCTIGRTFSARECQSYFPNKRRILKNSLSVGFLRPANRFESSASEMPSSPATCLWLPCWLWQKVRSSSMSSLISGSSILDRSGI